MTGTIQDHPEIGVISVKRNTLSAWAAKNAYTLVFLSVMFVITWVVIFAVGLYYGTPHH